MGQAAAEFARGQKMVNVAQAGTNVSAIGKPRQDLANYCKPP
jgi:hypothetical protein